MAGRWSLLNSMESTTSSKCVCGRLLDVGYGLVKVEFFIFTDFALHVNQSTLLL